MRRDLVHQPPHDVRAMRVAAEGPLARIFYAHEGAVSDRWHHYLEIYERHLARFRPAPILPWRTPAALAQPRRPIRLLEIGVQAGGSFPIWRRYLGGDAVLHGLEIDPSPGAAEALRSAGAVLHQGDQADAALLRRIAAEMGGIDVVIDDGGHRWDAQIASFDALYPLLSEDGIYLCEDTHTSYWPEYSCSPSVLRLAAPHSGAPPLSFIEYAKRKVDEIHAWHSSALVDETFARRTRSVLFYDSIVVFERGHRRPPRRAIVGGPRSAEPQGRGRSTRDKRLALVHLVHAANGLGPPAAFLAAYRAVPPGVDHDLILAGKGFEGGAVPAEYAALWADLEVTVLAVEDGGFDLGSYREAADRISAEYVCFVNSFSRPLAGHWLRMLSDAARRPGVGIAGATGSLEVDPHLRTNAFCMRRDLYLELVAHAPATKLDACAIEAGPESLTRRIQAIGLDVRIVDREGRDHALGASARTSGTFRWGDQAGLLVADNRTDGYASAGPDERARLTALAWGAEAPTSEGGILIV